MPTALLLAAALLAVALCAAVTPSPATALSFKYVGSFGHLGIGKGQFLNPIGVAAGPDGTEECRPAAGC